MEGEKERQRQQGEEKESNEADDSMRSDDDAADNDDEDSEGAAQVWQEGYSEDNMGLPIMHWEALSLRIAELEKQEEEKKEKMAKSRMSLERGRTPVSWTGERGRRRESWDDDDDDDDDEARNSHMTALSSRLQTQMNLQLCFINDSESEKEDEKEDDVSKKRGTIPVHKNPQPAAKPEKTKSRGFRNTWRKLRDRLRADHKPLTPATSNPIAQRRHMERSDLQSLTMKELDAQCSSLRQTIQDLSTELVRRLQIRDQLRTEQDAMLLEVQDMTSLGTPLNSPS